MNSWSESIKILSHVLLSPLFQTVIILGLILFITVKIRRKRRRSHAYVRTVSPELQLTAIPTYRRTLTRLNNELARVRRYQRPLSIIVLRIESDQLLLDLKRNLLPESRNGSVESYNQMMQTIRLVFSLVGSILRESLRESDIATYDVTNNQYIVLLPESNKLQAMQTVMRLKKLLFKRTAGHLVAGIAEFPTEGLIIEDLVHSAMEACNHKLNDEIRSKSEEERPPESSQSHNSRKSGNKL